MFPKNNTLPIVQAGIDQQLDCQTPIVRLETPSTTNVVYSWYDTYGQVDTLIQDAYLTINQPGLYYLVGRDVENGCVGKDTVQVTANFNVPELALPDQQTLGCKDSEIEITPTYDFVNDKRQIYLD